ncbi:MAG: hypothetical protein ACLFQY_21005 [Desulfococcaceae bacterium]
MPKMQIDVDPTQKRDWENLDFAIVNEPHHPDADNPPDWDALSPAERIERLMHPIDGAYRIDQALRPYAKVELMTTSGDRVRAHITARDGEKFLGIICNAEKPEHQDRLVSFRMDQVLRIVSGPKGEPWAE